MRASLLAALLLIGCAERPTAPEPPAPARPAAHAPTKAAGPACLPVLITGCGTCLGHCRGGRPRLDGVMGEPEDYRRGEHCLGDDCRPVWEHRIRQCYGLCQPAFEGWPECALRDGECLTTNDPDDHAR